MIAEEFEKYDYNFFLSEALKRVPKGIDKREGSIIYDAIAAVAYSNSEIAMNMRNVVLNAYTQTAVGEYLDYKAAERGTSREKATFTRVLAEFTNQQGNPLEVNIGDRFSSIGATPIFYAVSKILSSGQAELTAEIAGIAANAVIGQLLPITPFNNLGGAQIIEVSVPARDSEDDETLRNRLLNTNQTVKFGGNVVDYADFTKAIEGVGAVQVYPTWQGGGTVRLVILNNEYSNPSQILIDEAQEAIDPLDSQAGGYGIAPIGHVVTVAAPSVKQVNISVNIDTEGSVTVLDVIPEVEQAIEAYFLSRRHNWDKLIDERNYQIIIYRSQIMVEILKIHGIVNVSSITLNGASDDIILQSDNTRQEVAMVGSVVVNE